MAGSLLVEGQNLLGRALAKRKRMCSGVELIDKVSGFLGTVVEITAIVDFLRDDDPLERDVKRFVHQLERNGQHTTSADVSGVTLEVLDVLADDVIAMQAELETQLLVYELIIRVKNYVKKALGLDMEQFCALSEGCLFWSKKELRAVSATNEQGQAVLAKQLRRDGATWLDRDCPSTYLDDSQFARLHQRLRTGITKVDDLDIAALNRLICDMIRLQKRITELLTPEDELVGKKVPQFFTPYSEHLNKNPESSRIWSQLCSAIQKYARQTPEQFGRQATQAEISRNFGVHANAYRKLPYTELRNKMGHSPWNTGVLNLASWIALGYSYSSAPVDSGSTEILFTQSSQSDENETNTASGASTVSVEERAGGSIEPVASSGSWSDSRLVTVSKSAARTTGACASRFYRDPNGSLANSSESDIDNSANSQVELDSECEKLFSSVQPLLKSKPHKISGEKFKDQQL